MATVRTIDPHELDQLLERYRMLNPDDPPLDATDDGVATVWEEMLGADPITIVVVEYDDRIVSTCLLSVTPNLTRGASPFAVIENVVTHEDYRGRGFGKQCLDEAPDRAAEAGCYKAMLLTGTTREWKLDFHEACGFDRAEKIGFVRYLGAVPPER